MSTLKLLTSGLVLLVVAWFVYSLRITDGSVVTATSGTTSASSAHLSSYPDPATTPWFDEAKLAEVARINRFDLEWTYDPIYAGKNDGVVTVGWTFLQDYQAQDGFVYKFNSAISLDFESDLTFGEKLQAIGGKLDLYEPDGTPREILYQPLMYLLYDIYQYWENTGNLPGSVYDLNSELSDPQKMQAWWDIITGSDYILFSVFLERMGKYFHQACGTLIDLSTTFSPGPCRLNIKLVDDPDLRDYVVYLRTSSDSSFGSDNSDWFMLYYQLYGASPDKVIKEEVFFITPEMKQLINSGGAAQGATGGGPPVQGLPLPGKGGVGQLTK